MESRLQSAFAEAARRNARPEKKENFLRLSAEIGEDAGKLSPAFEIVSGGPHGFGTEGYAFIVDTKERLTLPQALREIRNPSPKKPSAREKIRALEKKIQELQNPPVVR